MAITLSRSARLAMAKALSDIYPTLRVEMGEDGSIILEPLSTPSIVEVEQGGYLTCCPVAPQDVETALREGWSVCIFPGTDVPPEPPRKTFWDFIMEEE